MSNFAPTALIWAPTHGNNWVFPQLSGLLKAVVPELANWRIIQYAAQGTNITPQVVLSVRQAKWWPRGWSEAQALAFCQAEGIGLLWLDFKVADALSWRIGSRHSGHVIKAPRTVEIRHPQGPLLATGQVALTSAHQAQLTGYQVMRALPIITPKKAAA